MSRIGPGSGAERLARLAAALEPHGLNLIGATPVDAYDAGVPAPHALRRLMPGAASAIVIGNGGGGLWSAFQRFLDRHPGHATDPDPLDAFTQRLVEGAAGDVLADVPTRLLYPFRFREEPVSFPHLAACAGLGRPALVGVLLHPEFGPWIALRAAILVPFPVTAPRPAAGFDPCPGCSVRSCIAACPAGAVGDAGWDVPRCAAFRGQADDPCAARCHARHDCVLGPAHRYPPEALAYHQARARPALLAFVRPRPPV